MSDILTQRFNLGTKTLGLSDKNPILPGLPPKFAPGAIVDRLGDRVIDSAVGAGFYGDDLRKEMARVTVSSLADEFAGAAISKTANKFGHDKFSLEKLAMKAVANCIAAEAKSGQCSAGALGSFVVDITTETRMTAGSPEEYRKKVQLLAATAGYLVSGGKAESVNVTMSAATIDLDNNWVWLAARAGLVAWTVYDVYESVTVLENTYDEFLADGKLTPEGARKLQEAAKSAGIDIAFDITAGKVVKGLRILERSANFSARVAGKVGVDKVIDRLEGKFYAINSGKLLWGSWKDDPKIAVDGREYAKIGDRNYSRRAVDRMQPSGLGTPAGADGPGRNVTPNMVEHVITSGSVKTVTVNNVPREIYTSGNVSIVTEDAGRTIVTILRNSSP